MKREPDPSPDGLEARLELWGRALGKFEGMSQEPRSLTGNSPIAAYGRPTGYKGVAEKRSREGRLKLMGTAAGMRGSLPPHFVDPVPCSATKIYKAPDFDPRYTQEVEKIQQEWIVMYRAQPLLAAVLRVEYQTKGRQSDKAEAMKMPTKSYKDQLRMAKLWLRARMAA